MLVQPDHPSSSVKLRRKNRHSEFADTHAEVKRRNRYSGGEFLVGSPVSRGHVSQQPPSQVEAMRKSGDWSYVSFPASSKSPPVTPKMTSKRPLSLMQNHLHHQPISLLETKVMASIIHNNSRERHEVRIYRTFWANFFNWQKLKIFRPFFHDWCEIWFKIFCIFAGWSTCQEIFHFFRLPPNLLIALL